MSIILKSVSKSFQTQPVIKDISLTIDPGEFVALTGKSGSGKSTLLYILSSLDTPTSGQILFNGKDLKSFTSKELHRFRNQHMGFVSQFHHLLPELTALENVLMPTLKQGLKEKKREYAIELLAEFGLSEKTNRLPRQLSGGEQQRVAIARALIMNPDYLFADEPTGNLDSINGDAVLKTFKKINETQGTTIIMVTHDPDFADLAKRQIYLVDGALSTKPKE